MRFDVFDLRKEFPFVVIPLFTHAFVWAIVFLAIATAHYLHFKNAFNNFEALILLCATICVCILSSTVMSYASIKVSKQILNISTTKSDLIKALKIMFGYSMFRFIFSFWKLRTEYSIKFIINAHSITNATSYDDAEKKVYKNMSYWMTLTYGPLGYTSHHSILSVIGWSTTLLTLIIYIVMQQNSGWVLLYTVFTAFLMHNMIKSRDVYVRSIHAAILTQNFYPLFEKKIKNDKLYVYEGISKQLNETQLFNLPVQKVSTIRELSNHYAQQTPQTISPSQSNELDQRIAYVKKQLQAGYAQDVLETALLEAGYSQESVSKIMVQAKTQ